MTILTFIIEAAEGCEENKDICTHFEKAGDLREQLELMGATIDDGEYAMSLLSSLPNLYKTILAVITATLTIQGSTVSPEVIIGVTTDEFNRHTLRSSKTKTDPEVAFAADGEQQQQQF